MKTWHWVVIVIVGVLVLAAVIDKGFNGPKVETVQRAVPETTAPATPAASPRGVTMAQYQQLRDGMSYAESQRILGGPGEEMSSSTIGSTRTVMYKWDGAGSVGANMNAMFQNDRLMMKAQYGLQ